MVMSLTAVGVIIGAAFGKIISSLVADIIMPPISMLLGGVDFTNMFIVLSGGSYATLEEAQAAGAVTINYGLFLIAVLDFLIVAIVLFLLLRPINKLTAKPRHLPLRLPRNALTASQLFPSKPPAARAAPPS
jgi:large conductance mechanosensitive channel